MKIKSILRNWASLVFPESTQQMQNNFIKIYQNNTWKGSKSISGNGSDLIQTKTIRDQLPILFQKFNIKTFADAPCGDFYWMKEVDFNLLDTYIGIDIVPTLIKENKGKYTNEKCTFEHKNIVVDPLPKVDLILCRDTLVHLQLNDAKKTIRNFKKSGSKYLLTTSFTKNRPNEELKQSGHWRTLNLQLPPFNFPDPVLTLNENCTESNGIYSDKSLCLWHLDDINI